MRLKWIVCCIYLIKVFSVSCLVFASHSPLIFTEEKVSKIATQLTSNCDPGVCYSTDIVQLVTHGSLSQYNQILHILNEKGTLCLRFILEGLKNELNKYNRVPISCEALTDEEKSSCQDMQAEYAVVRDRVLSLVNVMVSHNPNLITPFAEHLLENNASPHYISTELVNLLQRLEDEGSCSEYKIGEEKHFIITPVQSTILPYIYYKIKRKSKNHYKAFVTLKFSVHFSLWYDGDIPVPIDQMHNYYIEEKVRPCISEANLKMRGPHGEILEIVIEDAYQVDSCMPKHSIQIGSRYALRNAKYYHMNMHCSSTTHEIIHLLGLWDEYLEERYAPNYDCRVVQENSMLSSHGIRWGNVFDDENDDSLLDPSHFQAILYGNCSLRDDVKLYRQCSRLSYQTSSRNNACLAQKAYCDRQNVLGRDKIAEYQKISKKIQTLQAELNSLDVQLTNNPKLLKGHPEYYSIESIRDKLFRQQRKAQQQMPHLQKRHDLILSWPD